jgi:hypothetical protein
MESYDYLFRKKENYLISYKDSVTGEICAVPVEAHGKSEAEQAFREHVSRYCEIVKIQNNEEIAEEIAEGMMKHIKKDLGNLSKNTKKPVIDPNKVNNVSYNSKSFLKGLYRVNERAKMDSEMSMPNQDKKYSSFNI